LWRKCQESKVPYKPSTFDQDGGFIHATKEAHMLLGVANHFYKSDPSEYLLLRIDVKALVGSKHKIEVKYEAAAPVGNTTQTTNDANSKPDVDVVLFPHIYGALPVDTVTNEYLVKRGNDGTFLEVIGLKE
jgi:uncharacterized protein (DUF952 family)